MSPSIRSMPERVRVRLLTRLRRGRRPVSWVPDWMGLGNAMYQWLWAFQGQVGGQDRRVLINKATRQNGVMFPQARQRILLDRSEVRLLDDRVRPWSAEPHLDAPYQPESLTEFVREILLPGSGITPDDSARLVVNVRRGDYYSVPRIRADFGMDVVGYVREATDRLLAKMTPSGIHVVSDDPAWCARELAWLSDRAALSIAPASDGPVKNLREVAGARHLVLANSTFSYWAGYIGDVLQPGRDVVAPRFFQKSNLGGRSHLLRPNWEIVEPGEC